MFKVLTEGCEPTRGSKYSACVDLRASEDIVVGAGETVLVPLGVSIDFQKAKYLAFAMEDYGVYGDLTDSEKVDYFLKSHYLQLMLRSSLSKELIIANGVGVVDLDYEDEIMIRVHNPIKNTGSIEIQRGCHGYTHLPDVEDRYVFRYSKDVKIKKGDRVAQITLLEHKSHLFGIDTEDERSGGWGSSGK